MLSYTIKRLLWGLVAVFVVYSLTFALTRAVPTNPFAGERFSSEAAMQAKLAEFHLDKPWYEQYYIVLGQLITGDLEPYHLRGYTVVDVISGAFPISMTLGLTALLVALLIGMSIGAVAALFQNKWPDYLAMFLAVVGLSLPVFVVGTGLIFLFVFELGWFELADYGSFDDVILPALALAAPYAATIARFTRGGLLEVFSQDYVVTARAKGFPEHVVVIKHALKGALMPVITYIGPAMAFILVGTVVVEKLFSIPGMGQWILNSALAYDYNMVLAIAVLVSSLLVIFNLLVDLLYAWLDPRIRLHA